MRTTVAPARPEEQTHCRADRRGDKRLSTSQSVWARQESRSHREGFSRLHHKKIGSSHPERRPCARTCEKSAPAITGATDRARIIAFRGFRGSEKSTAQLCRNDTVRAFLPRGLFDRPPVPLLRRSLSRSRSPRPCSRSRPRSWRMCSRSGLRSRRACLLDAREDRPCERQHEGSTKKRKEKKKDSEQTRASALSAAHRTVLPPLLAVLDSCPLLLKALPLRWRETTTRRSACICDSYTNPA